jgi:Cysteine rich repeat
MIHSTPTLLTTVRDFSAVVFASVVGAVALFAIAGRAHAESLPPRHYEAPPSDYYEDYPPSPRTAWVACSPDVRRYCPNVLPGGGRILSCLGGNKDRLSPRCRDTLVRAWMYYRR